MAFEEINFEEIKAGLDKYMAGVEAKLNNTEKVKSCPFCGSDVMFDNFQLDDGYYSSIVCNECGCSLMSAGWTTPQEAKAEVVERWNTRYEPQTPGGAIVPAGNERLK